MNGLLDRWIDQPTDQTINTPTDQINLVHSLSLIPGRGVGGHRPDPFQVAPEASRVGCEGVSWPGVPPSMIVGRTLEHQMLDRLVGAVAVWADGRVPALIPVTVSCYQWGMTSDLVHLLWITRFPINRSAIWKHGNANKKL